MVSRKAPIIRFAELIVWSLSTTIVMPLAWMIAFASLFLLHSFTKLDFGIYTYLVSLLVIGLIVGFGTGLAQPKLIGYPVGR